MNNLSEFSNEKFGTVRVYTDGNGEPWFCGKDVLTALEYSQSHISNLAKAFEAVPDLWKGRYPLPTPGGTQDILCLSEQGLYFFLGRSDKPKALPYQMYIAGEVMPSIRKNGAYIQGQEVMSDSELIAKALVAANNILAERDKRIANLEYENTKQREEIGVMLPKAEYFDELVERNTLTGIRETAKELKVKQKPFVNFLLENGYCYRDQKDNLQPYMQHVQGNLFVLKECKSKKNKWSGTQIMITPTGRETFRLLKDKMQ